MSDKRNQYGYMYGHRGGRWVFCIYEVAKQWEIVEGSDFPIGGIVARIEADDWEGDGPPPNVRAEYERIIGYEPRPVDTNPLIRLGAVEMIAGDCGGFDQPCAFGNRVEDHAVYCHNSHWLYAPRKCRRTWHSGGEVRDEDCEGFSPNPQAKPKESP